MDWKSFVLCLLFVAVSVSAAKSYTLYEYSQPANFTSINLLAGGSLTENRTYCFQYIVAGDGWKYYGCSTNTMYMFSPVSNSTCVTTNSTHRIVNITWAKSADPSYSALYGVYLNHSLGYEAINNNSYYLNSVSNSTWRRYFGLNDEQKMETAGNCNSSLCWFVWDGVNQNHESVMYYEHGIPFLELSGGTAADPITPWDIYNWTVNNQSREEFVKFMPTLEGLQDAGVFKFKFSFGDYGGTSQTFQFNIPLNVVLMHETGKFVGCTNGNFTMGSYDSTRGVFKDGGVYLRTSQASIYNQASGAVNIYASMVSGGFVPSGNYTAGGANFRGYKSHGFQFSGVPRFNGALIVSRLGRMLAGADARNSLMIFGGEWGNNDWTKGTAMDNVVFSKEIISTGYNLQEIILRNFRSYPAYTDAWQQAISSNYGNYSHILHLVNPYWGVPHSRVRVYCSGIDHPTRVSQEFELSLSVVDSITGLPIENATLTIQDVNGSHASFGLPTTSLYDTVNATAGFLRLKDTSAINTGDYIKSGNEFMKVTGVNATSVQVTRGEFNTTPWSLRAERSYNTMIVFPAWREQYSNSTGEFELVRLQQKWWQKDICNGAYSLWYIDTEGNASSPFTITVNASGYNNFTAYYTPTAENSFTIGLKPYSNPWMINGTIVIKEGALIIKQCT